MEERKAVRPKVIPAAFAAVLFLSSSPMHAGGFFPDLQEAIKAAQDQNPVSIPALQQACNLSTALASLITGNDKDFSGSLDNLEKINKEVSDGLKSAIEKKHYQKPIKLINNLKFSDPMLKTEFLKNGDDLLVAIQAVVDKSTAIIGNIKAGKGKADDLTQLVQNNGDITQLILAFYLSVKA
jgi:hypothetical protein